MQDVVAKDVGLMVQANGGLKFTNEFSSKSTKRLRQLLLAAAVGGAMIAVPRVASAAPHTLSGSQTTTQSIADDDATVTTTSDFSVNNTVTPFGDAVSITGAGSISYDDGGYENNLTAIDDPGLGYGLYIESTNDIPSGNVGSITVNSSGVITGSEGGIATTNAGSGDISITATGNVSAIGDNAHSNGIHATNTVVGDSIEIYANNSNKISGTKNGIYVFNGGTGDTIIISNGDVIGADDNGISADNTSNATGDLEIIADNVSGNDFGIQATNRGSGNVTIVSTEAVSGTSNDGIQVTNQSGMTSGNVTVEANVVNGGTHGISATNQNNAGSITITTTGNVTGDTDGDGNGNGIYSRNEGIDLTINSTGNVTGEIGIDAQNLGSGNLSITNTSTVIGTHGDGINATNNGTNLTINVNNVKGNSDGIEATNNGNGNLDISASGDITGTNGDGIFAENTNAANTNRLNVTTGGGSNTVAITGNNHGINVNNAGTGQVDIYNYGSVTGNNGDGIHAVANVDANQTLSITGSKITGAAHGVFAQNNGVGGIQVTTLGEVEGTANDGIFVENTNSSSTGDVTVTANTVIGGALGIGAINSGTGDIIIGATGNVTGSSANGIYALQSNSGAGSITITATNNNHISGATHGIYAQNDGTADITVISNGFVTGNGATYDGIRALGSTINAGDLTVEANNVTGGQYGINVTNLGTSSTNVTTEGTVRGGTAGIHLSTASTTNPTILTINSGSLVQNSPDTPGSVSSPADLAIQITGTSGGTARIINNSAGYLQGIRGGVQLGDQDDTLVNNGYWDNNSGNSTFGGGNDHFSNNHTFFGTNGTLNFGDGDDSFTNGILWEAAGSTTNFGNGDDSLLNTGDWNANSSTVTFGTGTDVLTNTGTMQSFGSGTTVNGIETFNNDGGDITMQDGSVTGIVEITNGGTGIFNANGGILTVDTSIATLQSDQLHVDNVVTGSNGAIGVDVTVTDGLGQALSGDQLLIVDVGNGMGSSTPDAFVLGSPLSGGLFDYQLNQGASSPNWFLQSTVRPEATAANVLSVLGSRTALSTLSNMHDRQRDVEVLSDNANSRKGVWGRAFGQSNDFRSNDSNGFGFDSKVWGMQAGLDLKASNDGNGNRKYAGLYFAYANTSGDARQYDSKVADLDLNATTIGVYYTKYSASNWYLDLVAQYSRLGGINARTATDEIKPGGNSYALSLEVGKQFNPDSNIIREVQAQLINQYTDIDNVTLSDGSELNLSSMNAVTGRFGVRLYGNPENGKSFLPWLRANIWHTFSGDSTISSLGSSISTPIGGTSGELELGFSKGNAQSGGWGFYGSAGYLFDISGAEYSGWKGTLGLRKGW